MLKNKAAFSRGFFILVWSCKKHWKQLAREVCDMESNYRSFQTQDAQMEFLLETYAASELPVQLQKRSHSIELL